MIDTVTAQPEPRKLGSCVICGERVYKNQDYIEAVEGYTHENCVKLI